MELVPALAQLVPDEPALWEHCALITAHRRSTRCEKGEEDRVKVTGLLLISTLAAGVAVAETSALSFVSAGPSVVAPGGRVDFTLRVTNTGSEVWTPPSTTFCPDLVDLASFYPTCLDPYYVPGYYYVYVIALDMDSPSPTSDSNPTYGNALIPMPGPIGPGVTVDISAYVMASSKPGHYVLVPVTGQGRYNFTSHVLNSTQDGFDNAPHFAFVVAGDTTGPAVSYQGLIAGPCSLWPPDHKLVDVGTVTATDVPSGVYQLDMSVTSDDPAVTAGDFTVTGSGVGPRSVQLRAGRGGNGADRVYRIRTTATDGAGNTSVSEVTCSVPHDNRGH